MTAQQLLGELAKNRLVYEVIPHTTTTTAGDEAVTLGVPGDEVAKTLVLVTESGNVRAVVPASERLDLHKIRELLGSSKQTRLATETELAATYPMFELGAVPPFGGKAGDRTVVDRRLAEQESVIVEAGSHTESVRMRTRDLIALTQARIADISIH
jgi:Ala-tRNA(Pro) deacylase